MLAYILQVSTNRIPRKLQGNGTTLLGPRVLLSRGSLAPTTLCNGDFVANEPSLLTRALERDK